MESLNLDLEAPRQGKPGLADRISNLFRSLRGQNRSQPFEKLGQEDLSKAEGRAREAGDKLNAYTVKF